MITKTLAEAVRAVAYTADIRAQVGAGNTFRHPEEDIVTEFNSAYGEFRELLVERDFDFYLEETSQTNLPTSRADTNENYSLIDWPSNAMLIKRVDVYTQYNQWESLEQIDWSQLRLPRSVYPSGTEVADVPKFFSPKSAGTVSGATETAGKIALAPFCNRGKYKLSYLPHITAITNDLHKFVFPSETGFRWTVWNTIARISVRDTNPADRYEKSVNERKICEERIGKFIPKVVSTGGTRMRRSRNYNGG